MNLFYKISIDHVNANYISGWCFNRINANEIVELQCFCANDLVATVQADRFREDLKSLGVHRTGRCGFEFIIESPPTSSHVSYVIKVKRTGRELAVIDLSANHVRYTHPLSGTFFTKIKRMTQDNDLIVFMHIPKTAGTSFNTLAQHMFGSRSVRTHIELIDANRYKDIQSNYRYISGHLRFGDLDACFDSGKNDFYTILREPYAQLHSHLKWLIQTATDKNDTFFEHNNPTIHQLGMNLAGIKYFSPQKLSELVSQMKHVEAAFMDNTQTRYFLHESPSRVENHHLEEALSNASKFRLIGTTEKYDDFVEQFGKLSSIQVPAMQDRLNRSKSVDLFDYRDTEIREILRPLVHYDLALYNTVIN